MSANNVPSDIAHTRDLRSVDTSPGLHRPDRPLPQEYDISVDSESDKDLSQSRGDEQGVAPPMDRSPSWDGVREHETGTPYLPERASSWAQGRWNAIQAEFVDDPRRSVSDANQLVGELMQRIIAEFTEQRDALERQWSRGHEVSTEDLRLCLQGYRSFFSRLLPAVPSSDRDGYDSEDNSR